MLTDSALRSKVDALWDKPKHMRATHRKSLRQAEHLFQTLLHRAFTGGL